MGNTGSLERRASLGASKTSESSGAPNSPQSNTPCPSPSTARLSTATTTALRLPPPNYSRRALPTPTQPYLRIPRRRLRRPLRNHTTLYTIIPRPDECVYDYCHVTISVCDYVYDYDYYYGPGPCYCPDEQHPTGNPIYYYHGTLHGCTNSTDASTTSLINDYPSRLRLPLRVLLRLRILLLIRLRRRLVRRAPLITSVAPPTISIVRNHLGRLCILLQTTPLRAQQPILTPPRPLRMLRPRLLHVLRRQHATATLYYHYNGDDMGGAIRPTCTCGENRETLAFAIFEIRAMCDIYIYQ